MTIQRQQQQAADEFRALNEAEIETVTGGALDIDLGPLGIFSFEGGCVTYTQINYGDYSWRSVGQCPK